MALSHHLMRYKFSAWLAAMKLLVFANDYRPENLMATSLRYQNEYGTSRSASHISRNAQMEASNTLTLLSCIKEAIFVAFE